MENKGHPNIYGRKFIIEIDHKPLTWLWALKTPNTRLIFWRLKIEVYNYEIKYKNGYENKVADALSRIKINNQEEEDDSLLMLPQASGITGRNDLYSQRKPGIFTTCIRLKYTRI